MSVKLYDLEEAARAYASDARELRNLQEGLNDAIDKVTHTYMEQIRPVANRVAESRKLLEVLVIDAPELFEKPKTRTIAGVKFGFMKQPGKLDIPNPEGTIKKIRDDYPELALTAISVKESIVKKVLSGLSGDDLKRLGVVITADTDIPVVKLTDDEIQKFIEAMLIEQARQAE